MLRSTNAGTQLAGDTAARTCLGKAIAQPRKELRVGVVGCGYWGSKHVRVLSSLPGVSEVLAIDPRPQVLEAIIAAFPAVRPFHDLESALPHLDAVYIATPPQSHTELALLAIRHGKHVFVEKPLATSVADSRLIVDEARRAGVTLMVGHTFQFSPAVREMRDRLDRGEFGDVYYIHSARLNLGLYRPDVNVVWDLAPHDISIMNFMLRSRPTSVAAWGASLACPGVEDLAYVQVQYAEPKAVGYIHLSWLDPRKTRTVTLVGSKKMAVYDDLAEERVRIYDRGISATDFNAPFERPVSYRYGDIISPHIRTTEPLAAQDGHFLDSIRNGTEPESSGADALAIVAVLEAIERSLATRQPVEVVYPTDQDVAQPAITALSAATTTATAPATQPRKRRAPAFAGALLKEAC